MYCANPECPDFVSTGIPGEYREGITVCPYCGEPLVEERPNLDNPEPEGPQQGADDADTFVPEDDLEPVFETSDPTEVPIVRSFLDSQGIPHVVMGEERFDAFRGSLSPFRYHPRVGVVAFLVPSPYAEIARELLVALETSD